MNIHDYDIIIINSSGGKDSICAIFDICRMADEQKYSRDNIIVSHQDLGRVEWPGIKELVLRQSDYFGLRTVFSKRRRLNGENEDLLEYAERHGKWPSRNQRWCTSDLKRGPGARIVTAETKEIIEHKGKCTALYVFGFRKDESPARAKKEVFSLHKKLTTKKRTVHEYLPIHTWDDAMVWSTIKRNGIPYHYAYDLGMPRLSCCFCIFSPFDALVIAGRANPELLDEYIRVEKKIDHTFRDKFPISSVKEAIENNYQPKKIKTWVM